MISYRYAISFNATTKWNCKPGARSHNLNGVPVSGARLASHRTCWPANKTKIGVLKACPQHLIQYKFMQSIRFSNDCCACLIESRRMSRKNKLSARWYYHLTWQFCSIFRSELNSNLMLRDATVTFAFLHPNIIKHLPLLLSQISSYYPLSIPCCPATVAFGATGCRPRTMWTMWRKWCSRSSPTWEDLGACHGLMPQISSNSRLCGDRYDRVCDGLLWNRQESSAELVIERRRRMMIVQTCPEHTY